MSKVLHDDADSVYAYSTIMRSPKLLDLAYEVIDDGMDLEVFAVIFAREVGEQYGGYEEWTPAIREALLTLAEEEYGPFPAVDVEDIRRRLEEEG